MPFDEPIASLGNAGQKPGGKAEALAPQRIIQIGGTINEQCLSRPLPSSTNGLASRLQKPPKALGDLLLRQVVTALQRILAAFHRFHKTALFLEVPGKNLLGQIVGLPALLLCREGELGCQLRGDVQFLWLAPR